MRIISLVLFLIHLLSSVSSSEDSCTARCHQPMLKGKNIHPPAYSCESCHLLLGDRHPVKNKKTFSLISEVPLLCWTCHQEPKPLSSTHPPFKQGLCTGCHNPHESEHSGLLKESPEKVCLSCHEDKHKGNFLHGPSAAGDCFYCHGAHQSEKKFLLKNKEPDLCLDCHYDISIELKKPSIHPAINSGCSSCHNPHASNYRKFLINQGDRLCFSCHPLIEEKISRSKSVHRPIKTDKACASCHLPHSSSGTKLMEKSGMDACLECHKKFIDIKRDRYLHGPINNGDCSSCHDSHGSQYRKLLVMDFPEELYVPYNEKAYALCFSCHNRDLLRYPDTSFATGFRDGNRNLHYLHVNKKDKGRSCRFCHTIHGGTLPKLIAEKVRFGNWDLPVGFTKTETGGTCAPGCHRKYTYDRKTRAR
ncbi:MAG: cytochrome c3 family protein [Thermodesulfovibrionales bacterium]|nr:cytochrome c3 family protein [Thermodesulfovibrionales bacterium]